MHKFIPLLFVLILSCQSKNQKESETNQETNSSIELVDFNGQSIELKAEVTILNLWATWCRPCIAEMPDLEEMQKQLPEGFQLLLASDEPLDRQIKFIEKQDLDLTFIQITSSLEALGVYALPTTLILDSNGKVLDTLVGVRAWNTPEVLNQLTSYAK